MTEVMAMSREHIKWKQQLWLDLNESRDVAWKKEIQLIMQADHWPLSLSAKMGQAWSSFYRLQSHEGGNE